MKETTRCGGEICIHLSYTSLGLVSVAKEKEMPDERIGIVEGVKGSEELATIALAGAGTNFQEELEDARGVRVT